MAPPVASIWSEDCGQAQATAASTVSLSDFQHELSSLKHDLFSIWGSHSGGHEQFYVLGYKAV
jgi:hypothetical protein